MLSAMRRAWAAFSRRDGLKQIAIILIAVGSPRVEGLSNPVAAVPSLHAGWALGVGVGLVRYATQRWLQVLGAIYPAAVTLTIVVTGNHFIFDAIAGMVVLWAGFMVARLPRLRRRDVGYTCST